MIRIPCLDFFFNNACIDILNFLNYEDIFKYFLTCGDVNLFFQIRIIYFFTLNTKLFRVLFFFFFFNTDISSILYYVLKGIYNNNSKFKYL